MQPICSLYTAYIQPIYSVAITTRLPFAPRERRMFCKTSIQDLYIMLCVRHLVLDKEALLSCPKIRLTDACKHTGQMGNYRGQPIVWAGVM